MTLFSPKQIGLLTSVETQSIAGPTFKLKINKSKVMSYFLMIIKSLTPPTHHYPFSPQSLIISNSGFLI